MNELEFLRNSNEIRLWNSFQDFLENVIYEDINTPNSFRIQFFVEKAIEFNNPDLLCQILLEILLMFCMPKDKRPYFIKVIEETDMGRVKVDLNIFFHMQKTNINNILAGLANNEEQHTLCMGLVDKIIHVITSFVGVKNEFRLINPDSNKVVLRHKTVPSQFRP